MGAKAFDAAALVDFLQSFECNHLFLVGDIIDGWKLKKRWYWTESCNRVLDELIRKSMNGTKIIYLPGNHDEEVRHIMPLLRNRFARKLRIKIREKTVHTMADGRKFLVLHGDQFDRKILRGPLSRLSDRLYERLLDMIGGHNAPKIRIKDQIKPFSLAKTLSRHGTWALHLLNNFENAVVSMVRAQGADGLICGHTHIPVIKNLGGITYANSGAWLRYGHTALVEHDCGRLELLDCAASNNHPMLFDPVVQDTPQHYKIVPDSSHYRPVTLMLVRKIRKTWPKKQARNAIPAAAYPVVRKAFITTRLKWPEKMFNTVSLMHNETMSNYS